MEQPTEVTLKYGKTDLLMLEQAQTMHGNFVTDKVAFATPFLQFADPFDANFQQERASSLVPTISKHLVCIG